MSEQSYLWDKSGASDPFVARLESLLTEKRARVQLAGQMAVHLPRRPPRVLWVVGCVAMAAAAGVVIWFCSGKSAADASASTTPRVAIEADAPDAPGTGGSLDKSVGPKASEPVLDAQRPATTGSLRTDGK